MHPYFPIDVKSLSKQALRGWGPEDPEPLPFRPRRKLALPKLNRQSRARAQAQPRPGYR